MKRSLVERRTKDGIGVLKKVKAFKGIRISRKVKILLLFASDLLTWFWILANSFYFIKLAKRLTQ